MKNCHRVDTAGFNLYQQTNKMTKELLDLLLPPFTKEALIVLIEEQSDPEEFKCLKKEADFMAHCEHLEKKILNGEPVIVSDLELCCIQAGNDTMAFDSSWWDAIVWTSKGKYYAFNHASIS